MRRRRHLSAEERELWDQVNRHTTPLERRKAVSAAADRPVNHPVRHDPPPVPVVVPHMPVPKFHVGQTADWTRAHDLLAPITDRLHRAPLRMDAKTHKQMTQGKITPEGRIDLHGMTLAEAHPELIAFVLGAQAVGKRMVLVITGKGKDRDDGGPIPTRHGVLRHQVPMWLARPPLGQAVQQVVPAHLRHGGQGAYYVYLKKPR